MMQFTDIFQYNKTTTLILCNADDKRDFSQCVQSAHYTPLTVVTIACVVIPDLQSIRDIFSGDELPANSASSE